MWRKSQAANPVGLQEGFFEGHNQSGICSLEFRLVRLSTKYGNRRRKSRSCCTLSWQWPISRRAPNRKDSNCLSLNVPGFVVLKVNLAFPGSRIVVLGGLCTTRQRCNRHGYLLTSLIFHNLTYPALTSCAIYRRILYLHRCKRSSSPVSRIICDKGVVRGPWRCLCL